MGRGPTKTELATRVEELERDLEAARSTSTELAVREETLAPATAAERSQWDIMCSQAAVLSRAEGVIPAAYYGRPDNIIAAAMYGRTVGFDVPTSLRLIHVVEGKPSFAADALVALVRRSGHSISGEISAERAVARGVRADTGDDMTVEWTMEMARSAELAGKKNWKRYPQSMLWARAVSQLCRMLFADVTLGMAYTPEELAPDVAVDERGNVIEGTIVEPSPEQVAAREHHQARLDEMTVWAEAIAGTEYAEHWAAWKVEHKDWHKLATGIIDDAYIALRDLFVAAKAEAGEEPFGLGDDDIIDAEIVETDAPSSDGALEGEAGDEPRTEGMPQDAGDARPDTSPGLEPGSAAAESPAEPSADDGPAPFMSQGQSRRLHSLMRKAGIIGPDRHPWAAGHLGRPIESMSELTYDEAARLIDLADAETSEDPA